MDISVSIYLRHFELVDDHREAVEALARDGYLEQGRGLILVSEPQFAGYRGVAYQALPLPQALLDQNLCQLILTYNPVSEFVIMVADRGQIYVYRSEYSKPPLHYEWN